MRKIKFALQMKDGVQARTLEELRGAFDLELVMGHLADGKLERWLGDRFYEEEAEMIAGLDKESPDLGKRICDILQVPYPEELVDQDETSTATHGSSGNSDPEVVDPPADDPEGSVSGDDSSDGMSGRFPELAGLIATATSMDKLFVQIAESEGAMREINSMVDPIIKQYAEKLPSVDYRLVSDCDLTDNEIDSILAMLTEKAFIDEAIDTLIPKIVENFQSIEPGMSKTNHAVPSREACIRLIGEINGVKQILETIDHIVTTLNDILDIRRNNALKKWWLVCFENW